MAVQRSYDNRGGARSDAILSETSTMDLQDRYRGSLFGLAVGDALGTTLEFKPPGSFEPLVAMIGGGPFGLEPGEWTDDTSMALCLAASLVESGDFNPIDQLERYVRWYREGYFSSRGRCFDIGNTTAQALIRFEQTGEPYCGSTHPRTAGNGSIMRLAPVPLFFRTDPQSAIERAGESSRTTHGALEAVDACRYLASLILAALNGLPKETFLTNPDVLFPGIWNKTPLAPNIAKIAAGSFRDLEPPEIRGSGYVVQSLEAALWAFNRSTDFREGALLAVNLGDDADTTGAVYGQLAGAYYGAGSLFDDWVERLALRSTIESLADRLLQASQR